jgi:hypothetical protein
MNEPEMDEINGEPGLSDLVGGDPVSHGVRLRCWAEAVRNGMTE